MFKNYSWPDNPDEPFDGPELKDLQNGFWRVLRTMKYRTIVIHAGYESDLFSIPRLARWMYPKAMKKGNVASIFHDYLLSNLSSTHTREQADWIFLAAMRDAGVSKPRMMVIHTGVSGYTKWLDLKDKVKKFFSRDE